MTLFSLLNFVSGVLLVVYNALHYREKKQLLSGVSCSAIEYFKAKKWRGARGILAAAGFWTAMEIIVISCVQYLGVGFLNNWVARIFNTGANYFGTIVFAPMLVTALCVLVKIDPLAQLDLIAPAYPLALCVSKIACHFGGCCRGFAWEKGLYNPVSKLVEFPTPLLEAAVALLLFVFLLLCKGRFRKGTTIPIYLIAFSATRFFTEFTRVEPEVFLGLKTYHFLCIAGVLIGVLEYIAVCKYSARAGGNEARCPLKIENLG